MLNAIRLNTPFYELYRPNLDAAISAAITTPDGIPRLIQDAVQKAKTFLADSHDVIVDMSGLSGEGLGDGSCKLICAAGEVSLLQVISVLRSADESHCPRELTERAQIYATKLFSGV